MSLEVEARVALGTFSLDAAFRSGPGITALFGRSGSGKTTLVNVIAGLVPPAQGRVVVGGEVLTDTRTGVQVPPHRRRVGYVFQEARLLPHLSVRSNLLYGRLFTPRSERGESLERVADMLGIAHLLPRRPGGLSGGERQRVAIGRALLASPRLLLMDEPLASLDEARKTEILPYIERLRDEAGIPVVYVSHQIAEVTRLATTLVVLSEGRLAAVGDTAEVMSRLDLVPLNERLDAGSVLETRILSHDDSYGLTTLASAAGPLQVPLVAAPIGTTLRVRIRARDVVLATQAPQGLSALNVLVGTVAEIGSSEGAVVDVRLDCGGAAVLARVTRLSIHRLGLHAGSQVHAVVKSVAFDRRTVGLPAQAR